MSNISRLTQSNYNWLGEGSVVYTTGYRPNTPFADNPALQQLQKPYKDAQAQRRASQAADKAARLANRKGNVTVYDAVKRQYVSATPEEASCIRKVNKEVASQRRLAQVRPQGTGNVTVFDASKGLHVSATPEQARLIETANRSLATPNLPAVIQKPQYNIGEILNGGNKFNLNNPFTSSGSTAVATLGTGTGSGAAAGVGATAAGTANLPAVIQREPTELSVVSQTVTGETKKLGFWSKVKGLFGKAKNALKTGWGKFKAFAKTPKGKWGLVIAAVALIGTVLGASVVNRFSSKNNPTPTNGPDKINMPVADVPNNVEDEDTDDVDDVEETEKTTKNEEDDEVDDEDVDADKKADKTDTTESTKVVPVPVDTDDDEDVDEVDETDKTKKADESDKTDKSDKTEKAEETDKTDKSDKTEKAEETDKTDKTDKTDETKVPATEAEKKEADKVADANKDKREPDKVSGNEYEVVEGDCVWNIAKAHIKELNKDKADYTPSNVEILRHTKELMKINDLHYEADNYVVIIQPGQKIKLK